MISAPVSAILWDFSARIGTVVGRCLVAQHAVQHLAKSRAASLFREHPRTPLPGRVVAHVLVVATGKLGDPVILFVLMKARDRLLHDSSEQCSCVGICIVDGLTFTRILHAANANTAGRSVSSHHAVS